MRRKSTISGVAFSAGAKTLDFSGVSGFSIERLYAVLNGDALMYAVGTPGRGAASVAGSIVTLEYDTSSMADGDKLTIIYDSDDASATAAKQDDATTKLEAIRALLGGIALPVAEQQLRGVEDDSTPLGVMRIKSAISDLIRIPVPTSVAYSTTTQGTSTVSFASTGQVFNQDGSQSALNMNVAAGFPNGCSIRTTIYGRVFGVRFRKINSTPYFTVLIDGVAYGVKNTQPSFNGAAQSTQNDYEATVIIADDLADGPHSVEVAVPADSAASRTLVLAGFVVERRYQTEKLRLADVPLTGTLTTSAVGVTKTFSNVSYRGLWGVAYTNIHASATAVVTLKSGSTIIFQTTLAPKASDKFFFPAPVAFDGSTSTFNHLCDTASAVNFAAIESN